MPKKIKKLFNKSKKNIKNKKKRKMKKKKNVLRGGHMFSRFGFGRSKTKNTKYSELAHNNISGSIIEDVIEGVKQNSTISVILNSITLSELKKLCNALKTNNSVKEIDFTNCKFGDDGLKVLVEALSINPTKNALKLNLSGNNIGPEGIKKLVDKLAIKREDYYKKKIQPFIKLEELNLSNNPLTKQGVVTLSKAIHPVYESIISLKKLNLSETGIDKDKYDYRFGIADAFTKTDAKGKYNNIEELDLSNNNIGIGKKHNDLADLASILKGNSKLKKLNLSNNPMTDADIINLNILMFCDPKNSITELNLSNTDINNDMFKIMQYSIDDFINKDNTINLSGNPFTEDFIKSIMTHPKSMNIILNNKETYV